jgi:hypothetical protein
MLISTEDKKSDSNDSPIILREVITLNNQEVIIEMNAEDMVIDEEGNIF